jgi:glycosyltransferase involved in cell wall biosynthesis
MISIIVPIYNISQYLRECVDSLLHQSFSDIEIILVDDGSTDGSAEICDDYARKDSRIKAIHKANGGAVSARKAGLLAAAGNYIGFADGDDWVEPDMYERLYRILIEQNVDIVMCGRYEDTGDVHREVYQGIPEGRYDKAAMQKQIYPRMIVNGAFFEWGIFPGQCAKLFRRECLEPFQMMVEDEIVMGDDAACVYPCLLNVQSIYILHECLYHYRQTTSSTVKQVKDYESERRKFGILFRSVREELGKYADIYDMEDQWEKYVLFLMTPRADALYRGYEELDYLFPFPEVQKGSKIVLYGAGTYGQRLYRFLQRTGFCHVVAWVDRNYQQLQKQGLSVEAPEKLPSYSFDSVVIALSFANARAGLYQELIHKYPRYRIYQIDEDLIMSEETKRAFGLSEGEQ